MAWAYAPATVDQLTEVVNLCLRLAMAVWARDAERLDEESKRLSGQADGAAILDEVHHFLGRFVAYPSRGPGCAHALDRATPTYACLGIHPAHRVPVARARLGQDTSARGDRALGAAPGQAVNATPAYLFRKVSDEAVRRRSSTTRSTPSSARRRRTTRRSAGCSTPGTARVRSRAAAWSGARSIETEELPAYCAVALAGLDDLPGHDHDPFDRDPDAAPGARREGRAVPAHASQRTRRLNRLREALAAWAAARSSACRRLAGHARRHRGPQRRRLGSACLQSPTPPAGAGRSGRVLRL